jgi:PAS domain S-box-containing protein
LRIERKGDKLLNKKSRSSLGKQRFTKHSRCLDKSIHGKTAELEKEEEKLRSIFTASPDAITITDLSGRIIDCNPAALEMYGTTSKQDLIGKNSIELIAEKDRSRAIQNLKKTLRYGSTKNIQYTLLTKQGAEYLAELSASVVRDSSGNPTSFVGVIKEITERKRAEEALIQSEKKYRNVVDSLGIGVAIISPKMEILALNNQMKKWFPDINVEKKPICYKSFSNTPRKNICSYCPTSKTLADGQTHESITKPPRGNRVINYRVISSPIKDNDGKVTAAVEIVDDITERKRLEDELKRHSRLLKKLVEERTHRLQESETRFDSVANFASEAIITLDNHANIIFWNKAAETIFGYSQDEAISKPITLIMPKRIKKGAMKAMFQAISNREFALAGKTFQVLGLKKSGSEFPMELSVSVWKTRDKIFSTGIIRDVTQRKKLESERKHSEEMLSTLNSSGGRLNGAKSLTQIYDLTLDAMEQTLGFEHAAFLIITRGKLKPVSQRGYPSRLSFELPLDGTKKGITVKAAIKRKPVLVSDVSKDKDYVRGNSRAPRARSELAVPVIAEKQILGVLNVESKEINAFDEKDVMLLQVLASHAATAISNLEKRDEIEKRSSQQASLMKSSAEMIHSTDLHQRLQAILDAIRGLGWRRVVLSVRDENLDITKPEDIVTAGLTKEEREYLWTNKQPGQAWAERFGPEYERFKIGEFYYLSWSDPWVRKRFAEGTVSSHLKPEAMVDWDPDDLLYAPLRLADGRVIGVVSMDDPADGKRPTKESLIPLELFLHQAAVAIENARLIQQLNSAKTQIQEYANQLEVKVKERTKELVEAQTKLLKTERLAAIGELAGMVGHDLRNPLTGIAGAAYYMKTKYASNIDCKGRDMLEIIEKDIEHANKIINDLLEYSREMKLKLVETDPKSMLKEAIASMQIPENIKVLDKTSSELKLKVDAERIRRVLTNIIKNAVDAMPKGGNLTVKSEKIGQMMIMSFSDNGMGMPKDVLNKIWTPLFTTKAKGMGFGLPICKRIVEGHGGRISVESKVRKGTTFTIAIPVEPETREKDVQMWIGVPELLAVRTMKR